MLLSSELVSSANDTPLNLVKAALKRKRGMEEPMSNEDVIANVIQDITHCLQVGSTLYNTHQNNDTLIPILHTIPNRFVSASPSI